MEKEFSHKIMVVDDNITNLTIARRALEKQYNVVLIPNPKIALAELPNIKPDLILLDIEMPELNGFDVIKMIKNSMPAPLCNIPVIFLTAKQDGGSELEGFDYGAVDYITKPFSPILLQKRVSLHLSLYDYSTNLEKLVEHKKKEITDLQYAIIHALAEVADSRDTLTGGHIFRTRTYVEVLLTKAKEKGIYAEELIGVNPREYGHASQMHDVGKVSIPDSILSKPGKLNAEEYEIMKTHTTLGADVIKHAIKDVQGAYFLEVAAEFALTHHEKWDGTGYPHKLKGLEIPLSGRVMAIADVYDALVTARSYKPAFSHDTAYEIIVKDSGTHFDPILIEIFIENAEVLKNFAKHQNANATK